MNVFMQLLKTAGSRQADALGTSKQLQQPALPLQAMMVKDRQDPRPSMGGLHNAKRTLVRGTARFNERRGSGNRKVLVMIKTTPWGQCLNSVLRS